VAPGTTVSAWINGVKYAETTVSQPASDTLYGLNVPGEDPAEPGTQGGVEGDTVVFKIGELEVAQTGTWHQGTNEPVNLGNQADLGLTKVVDNDSPNVDDKVMFTITITNLGSSDATNVEVEDQWNPSAALSYLSHSASAGTTYDSGTGIWDVGTLAVGISATLHITATVDVEGDFNNIAQVHASDQHDPNDENDLAEAGGSAGPTAVTLSSFRTKSSAGDSTSGLWLGLVGVTVLAAGSLFWAKRRLA